MLSNVFFGCSLTKIWGVGFPRGLAVLLFIIFSSQKRGICELHSIKYIFGGLFCQLERYFCGIFTQLIVKFKLNG